MTMRGGYALKMGSDVSLNTQDPDETHLIRKITTTYMLIDGLADLLCKRRLGLR
jgi:hypothetical protein